MDNNSALGVSPCLTNLSITDYLGAYKSLQPVRVYQQYGKAVTNASL